MRVYAFLRFMSFYDFLCAIVSMAHKWRTKNHAKIIYFYIKISSKFLSLVYNKTLNKIYIYSNVKTWFLRACRFDSKIILLFG